MPDAATAPSARTSSSTPGNARVAAEGNVMSPHYVNAALDEELAYRRELLETAAIKANRGRRGAWFRLRRRAR